MPIVFNHSRGGANSPGLIEAVDRDARPPESRLVVRGEQPRPHRSFSLSESAVPAAKISGAPRPGLSAHHH
jgi:hypothetical protein